jgi:hypothetical protein
MLSVESVQFRYRKLNYQSPIMYFGKFETFSNFQIATFKRYSKALPHLSSPSSPAYQS